MVLGPHAQPRCARDTLGSELADWVLHFLQKLFTCIACARLHGGGSDANHAGHPGWRAQRLQEPMLPLLLASSPGNSPLSLFPSLAPGPALSPKCVMMSMALLMRMVRAAAADDDDEHRCS